jgi:hypothetical protein
MQLAAGVSQHRMMLVPTLLEDKFEPVQPNFKAALLPCRAMAWSVVLVRL